jgi:hypothetical protein
MFPILLINTVVNYVLLIVSYYKIMSNPCPAGYHCKCVKDLKCPEGYKKNEDGDCVWQRQKPTSPKSKTKASSKPKPQRKKKASPKPKARKPCKEGFEYYEPTKRCRKKPASPKKKKPTSPKKKPAPKPKPSSPKKKPAPKPKPSSPKKKPAPKPKPKRTRKEKKPASKSKGNTKEKPKQKQKPASPKSAGYGCTACKKVLADFQIPLSNADDGRRAYRKFSLQYHPDKTQGDKDKEEKFKKVTDCMDTIFNSGKCR